MPPLPAATPRVRRCFGRAYLRACACITACHCVRAEAVPVRRCKAASFRCELTPAYGHAGTGALTDAVALLWACTQSPTEP